jgi:hypothetical protein
VATSANLAFNHERVLDIDIKSLPKIDLLDNIKYHSWGQDFSDYLLMISTNSALIVLKK